MIISKLIGGLGNQMFQYAAGRALAIANNCDLKLDISGYKSYKLHNGYELDLFNIQASIAKNEEVFGLLKVRSRLFRLVGKRLGLKNKSLMIEKSFAFDPEFFYIKESVYIDGYWQSYKYFESIRQYLKIELTPKIPLSGLNLSIAESIGQVNAVSLHIRRGDYVNNLAANKVHGFLGIEYYKKAISYFVEKIPYPYFFVFSDDISWAKENLGLSSGVTFIEHNQGENSFEDMRLMSLCKHNIIANSSFSWWGAWLNDNPNKTVIAPNQWFASMLVSTDLLPASWLRL